MGRRYYQSDDIVLLAKIRDYLYKDFLTIKGVQKKLKDPSAPETAPVQNEQQQDSLSVLIQELTDINADLAQYL